MSYKPFSTDNADYFLVYADHRKETDEEIFEQPKINSLDAIILESCKIGYGDEILYHPQYFKIIINMIDSIKKTKKNLKIYLVDVGTASDWSEHSWRIRDCSQFLIGLGLSLSAVSDFKKRTNRRQFLKGGLKSLFGLGLIGGYVGVLINSSVKGEAIPVAPELASILGYLPPTSCVELRNAITARKTEEFVVPELQKELGRKPLVALVYGNAHVGIETDLKYKGLRDAVISIYKSIDYAGIEKNDLNFVYEIDLKNDYRKKHKVNLF